MVLGTIAATAPARDGHVHRSPHLASGHPARPLPLRVDDALDLVRRAIERLLGRGTGFIEFAFSLQVLVSRNVADGFLQPALHLFALVLAHLFRPFRQNVLLVVKPLPRWRPSDAGALDTGVETWARL